jgi:hypothetical protein
MELLLVNSEDLCESRLYRNTDGFRRMTAQNIADVFFLETLAVLMFSQDGDQRDYAKAYAQKTSQYGPYAAYRTAATDLYMLGFSINNPDYKSLRFKSNVEKSLAQLSFDNRRHYRMMRTIATTDATKSEMSSFLIRLESQLKIGNPLYKQLRRLVVDWDNLKYSQKQYIVAKLLQSLRSIKAQTTEIFNHLIAMKRERAYKDTTVNNEPSKLKRAAATVAGAYVGSKVAPKLSKNKISGTTGAGIGAIAGYWASGRKKQ